MMKMQVRKERVLLISVTTEQEQDDLTADVEWMGANLDLLKTRCLNSMTSKKTNWSLKSMQGFDWPIPDCPHAAAASCTESGLSSDRPLKSTEPMKARMPWGLDWLANANVRLPASSPLLEMKWNLCPSSNHSRRFDEGRGEEEEVEQTQERVMAMKEWWRSDESVEWAVAEARTNVQMKVARDFAEQVLAVPEMIARNRPPPHYCWMADLCSHLGVWCDGRPCSC